MSELDESVLDDDYPVYWDYLYVADGKVIRSDIKGTVKDLKRDLKTLTGNDVKEIKRCDIYGRKALIEKETRAVALTTTNTMSDKSQIEIMRDAFEDSVRNSPSARFILLDHNMKFDESRIFKADAHGVYFNKKLDNIRIGFQIGWQASRSAAIDDCENKLQSMPHSTLKFDGEIVTTKMAPSWMDCIEAIRNLKGE